MLPTQLWAYPRESRNKDNTGQMQGSQNSFSGTSSILAKLLLGKRRVKFIGFLGVCEALLVGLNLSKEWFIAVLLGQDSHSGLILNFSREGVH